MYECKRWNVEGPYSSTKRVLKSEWRTSSTVWVVGSLLRLSLSPNFETEYIVRYSAIKHSAGLTSKYRKVCCVVVERGDGYKVMPYCSVFSCGDFQCLFQRFCHIVRCSPVEIFSASFSDSDSSEIQWGILQYIIHLLLEFILFLNL